jgi:hypothetical protein
MTPMTELAAPALIVALVSFSILRAILPRRVRVHRQEAGAFQLQRPLGRRVLEVGRLLFWIVILVLFFLASWWNDFFLGILVGGIALAVLVSRAVDRIWRSEVVIDRLQNEVRCGGRREGRTSDVRAVALQRHWREPLGLMFREYGQAERRWIIPGADPTTAETVGREIAEYLGVPFEETP